MAKRISEFRRESARRLRSNTTSAEQLLWRELRRLPLYGTHFRWQVPTGPFIADFLCQRAKLLIEVDGGQHAEAQHAMRDDARTRWLEAEGYRVLRFWNSEVIRDPRAVLEKIYSALYGSPHAEPRVFTPPRLTPAACADPPPPGEGEGHA